MFAVAAVKLTILSDSSRVATTARNVFHDQPTILEKLNATRLVGAPQVAMAELAHLSRTQQHNDHQYPPKSNDTSNTHRSPAPGIHIASGCEHHTVTRAARDSDDVEAAQSTDMQREVGSRDFIDGCHAALLASAQLAIVVAAEGHNGAGRAAAVVGHRPKGQKIECKQVGLVAIEIETLRTTHSFS